MSSGAYLEIRKGDDYSYSTNVTVDSSPVDLYGSYLWFQGWGDPSGNVNDYQILINVSTNTGEISVSGNNNNAVTVTLNGSATANYQSANVLTWVLRCQTSAGKVYTLDHGLACIKDSLVAQPWST